MAIDPGAVGQKTGPVQVGWTAKDAMLYAVSVGVGSEDATQGLDYTTENTAGLTLKALPTLCVVLTGGVPLPGYGSYDRAKLLHAEQSIEWHRPLTAEGSAMVTRQVESLFDKGNAAIAVTCTDLCDMDGAPWVTTRSTAYIRDAGGFGGERGTARVWAVPDRAPDLVFAQQTARNQALIYRLNSDRNPLHSDPAFAARGGLDRPILHGLCTFGFVAQGLIGRTPFAPETWKRLAVRFSASVLPGERLTTHAWIGDNTVHFRTFVADRMVLDQGLLEIGA